MSIKDVTRCALFTALIAVCSWLSIPTEPPFTLQTLAVFLTLGVLGGRRGSASVAAYILLGAVGAPVFASVRGGIGVLLGPTGGYIAGFPAAALIFRALEKQTRGRVPAETASLLLGLLVCYAFGSVWYMLVYLRGGGTVALGAVLAKCVLPFVLPDLLKLALATAVSGRLKKLLR